MKTILKPFDIAKAKNGAKIVTRDGNKVRIICFDAKIEEPIIALIESNKGEYLESYNLNGFRHADKFPDDRDLMISEKIFEKGDFIYNESTKRIAIFDHYVPSPYKTFRVIILSNGTEFVYNPDIYFTKEFTLERLATEEEKERLLSLLKKSNKRYNAEKKCIEHNFIEEEFKQGQAVLVRDTDNDSWMGTIFIALSPLSLKDKGRYVTAIGIYNQCIDYNTNSNKLLTKTKIYNGNSL